MEPKKGRGLVKGRPSLGVSLRLLLSAIFSGAWYGVANPYNTAVDLGMYHGIRA